MRRDPALLLTIAGLAGLAAAFVLMVEKVEVLQDPLYIPTCSVNALVSCGSVMTSEQAEAFGFPNPLLGLIGFAAVTTTGLGLLAGARFRGWYWAGLQAGATAGFAFVHWLVFQSLYRIGALCPYCMVVWVVTAAVFWFVTLRNLSAWTARSPDGRAARAVRALSTVSAVPLTVWYLAVFCAIAIRFWDDALATIP